MKNQNEFLPPDCIRVCHENIDAQTLKYVEASSNYCLLHFSDGKQLLTGITLKKMEGRLSAFKNFIRVNRSILLNVNLVPYSVHGYLLDNDKRTNIARRRKRELNVPVF